LLPLESVAKGLHLLVFELVDGKAGHVPVNVLAPV
jgi:hypothetical protein